MAFESSSDAARKSPPCALVIFGASGDLTQRKLIPAIERLARRGRLPREFALVGVARSHMSDEDFAQRCRDSARRAGGETSASWTEITDHIRYVCGGYDDPGTYDKLADVLHEADSTRGTAGNRVYYLATPPTVFAPAVIGLAKGGLNVGAEPDSFARVVIEKPFGHDEESAKELYTHISAAFDESDIFRIDHYLGKDTVQNLLALRFANSIFEPIWNRTWVDSAQITVSETLGVEGRGGFYETAGAMRDIVQNHVLQVLSLFLMEPPTSFHPEAIRDEKVKLLRAIRIPRGEKIRRDAVRGQYTRGGTRGNLMAGYREEPDVDPLSKTETYAALRLDIDNWRWSDVPIYVRTGKRLPKRMTKVTLQFRRPPHLPLFPKEIKDMAPDCLVLHVQPEEGISLRFGAKVPGHTFQVRTASMDFSYGTGFPEKSPEAYERLILDSTIGDPTLFIRADEVGRSWRIVDPITEYWATDEDAPIPFYPAASWGPREAGELIERDGRSWLE